MSQNNKLGTGPLARIWDLSNDDYPRLQAQQRQKEMWRRALAYIARQRKSPLLRLWWRLDRALR